jgi:glycosyltransferase involved in cell wall biosynthesis/CDP-glycerol glycerophosphotransferase (TagB/SpsB family)
MIREIMKKYDFSVIIPVYNVENYIDEAIESIMNQTVGFENIQLILINDGSSDKSGEYCEDYARFHNVVYIDKENEGVSAARNTGIELATGEYTAFLDGDDKFSPDLLEVCKKYIEENFDKIDFTQVDTEFFDAKTGKHILSAGKETQIISMDGDVIVPMRVVFFKTDVLKKYRFDTELTISEDFKLMCQIAAEKGAFGYNTDTVYLYRRRPEGGSAINNQRSIIGAFKRVPGVYKYLIDRDIEQFGAVSVFTENIIAYDLQWFKGDYPDELKETPEYEQAWEAFLYCLKYLNIDVIKKQKYLSLAHIIGWLNLKHGKAFLDEKSSIPKIYYGDNLFVNFGSTLLWTEIIGEKNGKFYMRGLFYTPLQEETKISAFYNGDYFTAETEITENFQRQTFYMGKVINSAVWFNLEIPVESESFIQIFIETPNGRKVPANISHSFTSRFDTEVKNQYFTGENFIVCKTESSNIFQLRKKTYENIVGTVIGITLKHNTVFPFGLYRYFDEIMFYIDNFKKYENRRIWIFSDRVYDSDDNSWVLFNYAAKQKDGIEKYYLISSKYSKWNELKKHKNILDWENPQDRAVLFFAEKFISSQTIREFTKTDKSFRLFNIFFNAEEIFLQHGIIKDDISLAYNHYNRDFTMFLTSAEKEYQSVLQRKYGFNENIVKCIGLPRFDNLRSNPEKIIIFAPTWRKYKGFIIEGKYNETFKNSEFFLKLQQFISNEKLYDILSKSGYKILWKLHPLLSPQLCDFTLPNNNLFEVAEEEFTYSEIFEKGSLFITDFSSTMFDFAYLKKPCIYWQEVPNHSPSDYFDYETMAFGEVVYSVTELVNAIEKNVLKNCKMPVKYQKRVEKFFKYTDKNNCKRCYDLLKGIEKID